MRRLLGSHFLMSHSRMLHLHELFLSLGVLDSQVRLCRAVRFLTAPLTLPHPEAALQYRDSSLDSRERDCLGLRKLLGIVGGFRLLVLLDQSFHVLYVSF